MRMRWHAQHILDLQIEDHASEGCLFVNEHELEVDQPTKIQQKKVNRIEVCKTVILK